LLEGLPSGARAEANAKTSGVPILRLLGERALEHGVERRGQAGLDRARARRGLAQDLLEHGGEGGPHEGRPPDHQRVEDGGERVLIRLRRRVAQRAQLLG
jgi:hypothetical protein